jgi:hypothetical protein
MNYSFHPHAEKEIEGAQDYYDGVKELLGDRFRAEVEVAIERILKFPDAWQPQSKSTRRYRLKSFPYGIVYQIKKDEILPVAVMHLHREPNYWAHRISTLR